MENCLYYFHYLQNFFNFLCIFSFFQFFSCLTEFNRYPYQACFKKCQQSYYLCMIVISEKESGINEQDKSYLVNSTCSPNFCNAKCTGQAIATHQQQGR